MFNPTAIGTYPEAVAPVTWPKIMCCGDSITYGNGVTFGFGAYKQALADLIRTNKRFVPKAGTHFVGGMYNGYCSYPLCGYPGVSAATLNSSYLTTDIALLPTACLLHIGTNNIAAANPTATIISQIGDCLNTIRAGAPTCRVFLAKLIDFQAYTSAVTDLNTAIDTMVSGRSDKDYITVVDQFSAVGPYGSGTYYRDDRHPNDAGNVLMATAWYNAIAAIYT